MKADRKSKLGDLIYISKIKLNILSIGHDNIKKRIKIFEFSTFDKPGMKDFRLDVKQKCRGIRIPTLFKNWGSVWITVGDDLVEPMAYSKVNITRGRELNYPLPSIDLDNARLGREPITEEREPGNFFYLTELLLLTQHPFWVWSINQTELFTPGVQLGQLSRANNG